MNFADFIGKFLDLIKITIPVVASLALLAFFWGIAKFIFNAGNEKAVTEGRNLLIWGTIALFVMVSVWGIIRFLQGDLGLGDFFLPLLPTH